MAAITMATIIHMDALLGIPVNSAIPPDIFMIPCPREPAMPAPMQNRVMASIILEVFLLSAYFPSTGAISEVMENGLFAL